MSELPATRLQQPARSLPQESGIGIHKVALYGAFALIAAVVLGTLPIHPF